MQTGSLKHNASIILEQAARYHANLAPFGERLLPSVSICELIWLSLMDASL